LVYNINIVNKNKQNIGGIEMKKIKTDKVFHSAKRVKRNSIIMIIIFVIFNLIFLLGEGYALSGIFSTIMLWKFISLHLQYRNWLHSKTEEAKINS
jgi:hypothetical protein